MRLVDELYERKHFHCHRGHINRTACKIVAIAGKYVICELPLRSADEPVAEPRLVRNCLVRLGASSYECAKAVRTPP